MLGRYPFKTIHLGDILYEGSHLKVISLPYVCILILKLSIRSQQNNSLRPHDIEDIRSTLQNLKMTQQHFEKEMLFFLNDIESEVIRKDITNNYDKYKSLFWTNS